MPARYRLDSRVREKNKITEIAELLLLAGRPEEALPYLGVAQEQLQSGRQTVADRQLLATVLRLQEQTAP